MKKRISKKENYKIPRWFVDGNVGILALFIYNFLLYLVKINEFGGFLASLEEAIGYFGLNTFILLNFNVWEQIVGVIIFFIVAFLIGVLIGKLVRRKKKYLI